MTIRSKIRIIYNTKYDFFICVKCLKSYNFETERVYLNLSRDLFVPLRVKAALGTIEIKSLILKFGGVLINFIETIFDIINVARFLNDSPHSLLMDAFNITMTYLRSFHRYIYIYIYVRRISI